MKVSRNPHSTQTLQPTEALGPTSSADLKAFRRARAVSRRKARNSSLTRRRRSGTPTGKRSRPETPLLKWKIEDKGGKVQRGDVEDENHGEDGNGEARVEKETARRKGGRGKTTVKAVSARKLAAELWRLQISDTATTAGERRGSDRLGFQTGADYVGVPFLHHHKDKPYGHERSNPRQIPSSVAAMKHGFMSKLEPGNLFFHSAMERATKWDPICLEAMDEVHQIYSHIKRVDQQVSAVSLVSSLEVELEEARARVQALETEKRAQKKKLEQFLRKVSEERAAWRSREHEKIRAFIDDMKADLNREKKNRQRVEIINSKLVNELAEAKLAAKRFMQDYDKERKARELVEEVCDELAKEIGEDKAEAEELKRESQNLREEVDDERRMLQMAEVWREERVQMKLVDAKVALEVKYSQMNKLVADLEVFLNSRNAATTDVKDIRDAESLRQAAASINIQDLKEFAYEPANPDDIFSVFEETNLGGSQERKIEPCVACSPASHASKVHTVSPEINLINRERHSNVFMDQNGDVEEDESGWETVSHFEEQGSSYSPDGSIPSVNNNGRVSNVSKSGTECDDTLITEISEVCSFPRRQSKKVSSVAKLWRSGSNNGEDYKTICVEAMNGRVSNGRKSHVGVVVSPDRGSGKGGFSPLDLMGEWSPPDSANPNRGRKGCIEWPRGAQKNSLKAKLLEARIESQKVQLKHVLNQKI